LIGSGISVAANIPIVQPFIVKERKVVACEAIVGTIDIGHPLARQTVAVALALQLGQAWRHAARHRKDWLVVGSVWVRVATRRARSFTMTQDFRVSIIMRPRAKL